MEKKFSNGLIDVELPDGNEKYLDSNYTQNSPKSSKRSNHDEVEEYVRKYVSLDDILKEKELEIKTLKSQKHTNETKILGYLEKVNVDIIEMPDTMLHKQKVENKTPINIDMIKKVLNDKITDIRLVEEILNKIEDSRIIKEKTSLKRVRKGRNKK